MRRPARTSLLRPAAGGPLILSAGAGLASATLAAAGIAVVEMGQPWLTALALPPILLLMLACVGLTVHSVRRLREVSAVTDGGTGPQYPCLARRNDEQHPA